MHRHLVHAKVIYVTVK